MQCATRGPGNSAVLVRKVQGTAGGAGKPRIVGTKATRAHEVAALSDGSAPVSMIASGMGPTLHHARGWSSYARARALTSQHGESMTREEEEKAFFKRGRELLGKNCGGLLATLLKTRNQDVKSALRIIETAATKLDPREYVAAACQYRQNEPKEKPVSATVREKREYAAKIGRFYAHASSRQWEAWDKYLRTQGKPGAIRDKDGGWWFTSEWPPEFSSFNRRR